MSKRNHWKQREKELKTEIERLTEQVELLTSEVDHLKEILAAQNTENDKTPEYHETPSRVVKSDTSSQVVKVCRCNGQCANKKCGCVKRHALCSKLCECSSAVCQNKEKNDKEQNKENLENIEVAHVEAKQTSNKNLINVARRRGGLFSPNTTMVSSTSNIEQYVLSPVQFKSPTQMSKSDSEEGTSEQLTRAIEDQETKDNFDPMKPKHQLARTPPKDKKFVHSHTDSSSSSLTPDIVQEKDERKTEEELQVPEEFNQPEVDWEKYQAQLVPCNKCKRKFHPNRVEKHQECCKKM